MIVNIEGQVSNGVFVREFDPHLFYANDAGRQSSDALVSVLRKQAQSLLTDYRQWRSMRDTCAIEMHDYSCSHKKRVELKLFYIEDMMCITERSFKEAYACYRLAREFR